MNIEGQTHGSYTVNPWVAKGWQCPICGRVYSPTTYMCLFCGGKEVTVTSGTNPSFGDSTGFTEMLMQMAKEKNESNDFCSYAERRTDGKVY